MERIMKHMPIILKPEEIINNLNDVFQKMIVKD